VDVLREFEEAGVDEILTRPVLPDVLRDALAHAYRNVKKRST